MEPRAYFPAYLERAYLKSHTDLTPAAIELVRSDIAEHPDKYAADEHAQALVAYGRLHERLMRELNRMEDLGDDEFEKARGKLFDEVRLSLFKICETDPRCFDAQLLTVLLADTPLDSCLSDLMKLEPRIREHLDAAIPGFDANAPHFWNEGVLADDGDDAAARTIATPELVAWLHTLEAISQLSLASARYRAAARYAQQAMRAVGYRTRAIGTVLLSLARLEDEDAFFELAHKEPETVDGPLENSPWYLLGRTLLLYKAGKKKPAKRALVDFVSRCEGAAYFLLNPTYMTPYLPVRPEPRESWDLSRMALWEADAIIADTPEFAPWAESIDGVAATADEFARRYGF